MPDSPPRDALVIRFPPGGPDEVNQMRKEAKYVHRHHQKTAEEPWYRLSAWVDVPHPDETDVEVLQRLIVAAGLASIRLDEVRNSVIWWTTAAQIYDAGFALVKDGEPDEAKEHYSIDLGNDPDRQIVEVLAGLFEGPRPAQGEVPL